MGFPKLSKIFGKKKKKKKLLEEKEEENRVLEERQKELEDELTILKNELEKTESLLSEEGKQKEGLAVLLKNERAEKEDKVLVLEARLKELTDKLAKGKYEAEEEEERNREQQKELKAKLTKLKNECERKECLLVEFEQAKQKDGLAILILKKEKADKEERLLTLEALLKDAEKNARACKEAEVIALSELSRMERSFNREKMEKMTAEIERQNIELQTIKNGRDRVPADGGPDRKAEYLSNDLQKRFSLMQFENSVMKDELEKLRSPKKAHSVVDSFSPFDSSNMSKEGQSPTLNVDLEIAKVNSLQAELSSAHQMRDRLEHVIDEMRCERKTDKLKIDELNNRLKQLSEEVKESLCTCADGALLKDRVDRDEKDKLFEAFKENHAKEIEMMGVRIERLCGRNPLEQTADSAVKEEEKKLLNSEEKPMINKSSAENNEGSDCTTLKMDDNITLVTDEVSSVPDLGDKTPQDTDGMTEDKTRDVTKENGLEKETQEKYEEEIKTLKAEIEKLRKAPKDLERRVAELEAQNRLLNNELSRMFGGDGGTFCPQDTDKKDKLSDETKEEYEKKIKTLNAEIETLRTEQKEQVKENAPAQSGDSEVERKNLERRVSELEAQNKLLNAELSRMFAADGGTAGPNVTSKKEKLLEEPNEKQGTTDTEGLNTEQKEEAKDNVKENAPAKPCESDLQRKNSDLERGVSELEAQNRLLNGELNRMFVADGGTACPNVTSEERAKENMTDQPLASGAAVCTCDRPDTNENRKLQEEQNIASVADSSPVSGNKEEIDRMTLSNVELKAKVKEAKAELTSLQELKDGLEKDIKNMKNVKKQDDKKMAELTEKVKQKNDEVEKFKKVTGAEMDTLKADLQKRVDEIIELGERLDDVEQDFEKARHDLAKTREDLARAQQDLAKAQKDLANARADLESTSQDKQQLLRAHTRECQDRTTLQGEVAKLQTEIGCLQKELEDKEMFATNQAILCEKEFQAIQGKLAQCEADKTKLEKKVQDLLEAMAEWEVDRHTFAQLKDQVAQYEDELWDLQEANDYLKKKRDSLMVCNRELAVKAENNEMAPRVESLEEKLELLLTQRCAPIESEGKPVSLGLEDPSVINAMAAKKTKENDKREDKASDSEIIEDLTERKALKKPRKYMFGHILPEKVFVKELSRLREKGGSIPEEGEERKGVIEKQKQSVVRGHLRRPKIFYTGKKSEEGKASRNSRQ